MHKDFYDLKFRKEKQKPQSLERISKDEYRQLLKDEIITSVLRMRYNWQRKKKTSLYKYTDKEET